MNECKVEPIAFTCGAYKCENDQHTTSDTLYIAPPQGAFTVAASTIRGVRSGLTKDGSISITGFSLISTRQLSATYRNFEDAHFAHT